MDGTKKIPELLLLLYGERAAAALDSANDRLLLWAHAFDDWLESIPKSGVRSPRNSARSAWRDFLAFYQGMPWNVTPQDVDRWRDELLKRGLSPYTTFYKLRSLRDFYQRCLEAGFDPQSPAAFNHITLKSLRHNPIYDSIVFMSPAEARLLLAAVDRDRSLLGKRDFAILLLALRTGLESGPIRRIRWGDLVEEGQGARLQCPSWGMKAMSEKGQCGIRPSALRTVSVPPDAWAAVLDFLRASGRLPSMQPDSYLFPPLADPLDSQPTGAAQDWAEGRPLAQGQFRSLLKQYARWAGLDDSKITWHCLRYTAAALRLEAGEDTEEIGRFLGIATPAQVRALVAHLSRGPQASLLRPSDQSPSGPTARLARGGQPGVAHNLVTGFYASRPSPAGLRSPISPTGSGLNDALASMQEILDRAKGMADGAENMDELLHLVDIYSKTAGRMVNIQKAQGGLKAINAAFRDFYDRALGKALNQVSRQIARGEFPPHEPFNIEQDEALLEAYTRLLRLLLDNPDKLDELFHKDSP